MNDYLKTRQKTSGPEINQRTNCETTCEKRWKELSYLIYDRMETLVELIVEKQYRLQPELYNRYGQAGKRKAFSDTHHTMEYLNNAIEYNTPEIFSEYIVWLKCLLLNLGMKSNIISINLQSIRDTLIQHLPGEFHDILNHFLEIGIQQLGDRETDDLQFFSFIDKNAQHGEKADRYLHFLLSKDSDERQAVRFISDTLNEGLSVKEVYLDIIQPAQHEIGRLWQMNKITVAHEHYATAMTQLAIAGLYPHLFSSPRIGRSMMTVCVGGELHAIGSRIVTDIFELEGWDTYYLGANTPTNSVIQMLTEKQIDLLAISATMTFNLREAENLIQAVRNSITPHIPIIVGGYVFNTAPSLWKKIGATGYASDADTAVKTAEKFFISPNRIKPIKP